MGLKFFNHINVGYWNVHGILERINNHNESKLSDPDFPKLFKNIDLFCLSETHIGPDFGMTLKGFKSIKSCRKISGNNRYFGGLCIFISNLIKQGVKVVKNDHPDIIWIKLKKDFFNLSKNIFICFTYISPSDSDYYKNNNFTSDDLFEYIRQDCAEFRPKGNILLMGDINAYLPSNATDYLTNDTFDDHVPLPDNIYQPDNPLPRNTMETRNINHNGKLLIDMCKSVPLRILNGRTTGDSFGTLTRYPIYNGQNQIPLPSVIDYALWDRDILQKIKYFSISELNRFSNHCMIKLSLETKFKTITEDAYSNLVSASSKFKWCNIYKNKLIDEFNSAQCQSSLMDFYSSSFEANQAGIDSATSQLTNIIVGTTSKVVPLKTNFKKKKAKKKWFDKSCFQLKHELNRLCRRVSKNPLNPTVRKAYIDCRKSYKRLLKYKENLHFIDLKNKLRNLGTNNPKQFWEIIRQLQNYHNESINPIDFETWDTYFKNLYKCENSTTEENYNSGVDMQNNDADAINFILNRIISSIEVQKAIKKLKAGKSAGEDKVINEILKFWNLHFCCASLNLLT